MATTPETPSTDDLSDGTPMEAMDDASGPVETSSVDDEVEGSAPETVNLVATLPPEEAKKIADAVCDDYDRDWRSSEKFRSKRAELVRLCIGELPPKEDGYAQIHYSVIMKAVVKLHARVYDQQFPSNGEFFGARPTSFADLERSVRIGKHMNWQILHQIPEYVPNHDRLIMQWYIYGSAFSKMYWNPVKNRACHAALLTEDMVLPYAYATEAEDPSMSGLPRITHRQRKYRFGPDGLDALAASGYYDQDAVDAIFADDAESQTQGSTQDQTTEPMSQVIDRASGVEKPESDKGGPRLLLEQHRWWKLPEWDAYRPVIATIDRDTKKLLFFALREDEDPVDRSRYNREKAANDAQHAFAMQQYEQDLRAYEMNLAGLPLAPGPQTMTAPPMPGAGDMTPLPMPGETTPTVPGMAPPLPPVPPPEPEQPKMVPINFFTHFICIPNPEGIYGFGIGYLLEGNNLTADALGSALVTSAMLSNTPTGLASREAKAGSGDIKIKPGEIIRTEAMPQDIDKVI
ncbi:MAG TPA: hypothetical protein VFL67_12435, partial [Mycobacterium sp.]|nr:hypothetical protein [Mycobacterium sp.]